MDLATDCAGQAWPQVFRQLVVANSCFWLNYAREDVSRLLTEIPQVLRGLSYALSLTEAWQSARDLMLRISPLMIRQGQGIQWESFLTKGILRSSEEKDPAEIEFHLQLGNLYRLQGRLAEAQDSFQVALGLCDQHEVRTHYWTLLNRLGLVARLSAQHEEALAHCQQVLDEGSVLISERAEALNVMGLVAYDRRRWEEALNCFDQALTLYRSLDDSYQMARILNNRGLVLLRRDDWDQARESYQEAIHLFRAANDQTELFKAVMNLGNVFLMKKEYEAAIKQYLEALPAFKQSNYLIDLANAYNNLGMAYTGLANWQAAEAYFSASLEIACSLSDAYYLVNTLDNLGDMLIKAERAKRAREVLCQALEILDAAPDSPAYTFLQRTIEDRLAHLDDNL